jgi:DNA-binding HxlR family transcriptional regulator
MTGPVSSSLNESKAICATLNILSGKWKILILFSLLEGTKRFNELRRLIPGVTQRMLTSQLRELEEQQVIARKVFAQVPPKVEYSLSEIGNTLTPILMGLKKWGACYLEKIGR